MGRRRKDYVEEKYAIICSTDPYNASKYSYKFHGKSYYIIADDMSKKSANDKMLELFNTINDECGNPVYATNWGLAVIFSGRSQNGCRWAGADHNGCRVFYEDVYKFKAISQTELATI